MRLWWMILISLSRISYRQVDAIVVNKVKSIWRRVTDAVYLDFYNMKLWWVIVIVLMYLSYKSYINLQLGTFQEKSLQVFHINVLQF